jgi:hypothetical protein
MAEEPGRGCTPCREAEHCAGTRRQRGFRRTRRCSPQETAPGRARNSAGAHIVTFMSMQSRASRPVALILAGAAALLPSSSRVGAAPHPTPRPWPTVVPSVRSAARATLSGFGSAIVQHNLRRARSYFAPRFSGVCAGAFWRDKRGSEKALLCDTPYPARYSVCLIENLVRSGRILDALVIFGWGSKRPPNVTMLTCPAVAYKSQPLWFTLMKHRGRWLISGIGLPHG